MEVPTAVETRKGSTISPEDQQAKFYFLPKTLAQDTIVTVNALSKVKIEAPIPPPLLLWTNRLRPLLRFIDMAGYLVDLLAYQ